MYPVDVHPLKSSGHPVDYQWVPANIRDVAVQNVEVVSLGVINSEKSWKIWKIFYLHLLTIICIYSPYWHFSVFSLALLKVLCLHQKH
jgi:hypothetical protein